MKKSILIITILSVALAGSIFAQGSKSLSVKQPKMTIKGKIAKAEQGYIIQGQQPPELFNILNANPDVLDKLVRSNKTVTIEAVSILGDNVNIEKIDGKPYREGKRSKE